MGSNYSFKEYGKNFENTLSASDLISLNQLKIKPRKITHLRVWIDEYIVGFEWFYDGISAGARFGNEYREAEYFDFVLENYEHIYKVWGTSREIIDTLTFLTTYGRQFTVGKNRDGRYFELTSGIKIVKGFKVGFGRYLHKFGAFFGKRPSGEPIQRPMIRHQTFTSRYNPNFSNNQEYNQANRRFTSYPVHQNYGLANANTSLFSSNASQPQIIIILLNDLLLNKNPRK